MTRDHVLSSRLSFFQSCSFYLRLRRPPRQPLFPYTTLFRSEPTAHPAKGSLPLTRRNWRPVAAKSPVSPPLRLPVLRRRACHPIPLAQLRPFRRRRRQSRPASPD